MTERDFLHNLLNDVTKIDMRIKLLQSMQSKKTLTDKELKNSLSQLEKNINNIVECAKQRRKELGD